jgi:predicted anti-sigma-YlaC factor YlaD
MNDRKNSKKILEAAIDAVRTAEPGRTEMENSAARVWARIGRELAPEDGIGPSVAQIRTCDDYRALIPDYIAGRLSSARSILFTDHTHECVACRNALNAARGTLRQPKAVRADRRLNRTVAVFAIAATLILGIALGQAGYLNFLLPAVEVKAVARTIDGKLYRVAGLEMTTVNAGDNLNAGQPVRTAAESGAVIELADGTRIEMRERSQLSLTGSRDGIRVNLDRGSVIIEAAKQRNGHLYVATDDCTVSVVGTVFAVSSGVKGSRVSVLEGEVHVAQSSSAEQALRPGEQMTTTPNLAAVTIAEEISWSRNRDTHLALLRALADVNAFLRDRVPGPQLRFSSKLLPLVPANTVVYGAFPNLSSVLGQGYDLFRQKINQSALLQAWWAQQNQRKSPTDLTLSEMIDHVRVLGSHLGDEIAVAVTGSRSGPEDVMVLADVRNPSGVLAEINTIARSSSGNTIRVLTDPAQLASFRGNEQGPVAYIGGSVLVLASSPRAVYDVIVAQRSGASGFSARPFYSSLAQAYSKGAGTLFAADLATLASDAQRSEEARALGLREIDRLVIEQKQVAGKTTTQAQLNFNAERSGLAAWLAPAAPMGALEFVSPQAYGIASAVTKDASAILDEMLKLGPFPQGQSELDQFQRASGIDIRRDLAEPLGGEFLIAMDGPFLPTPSWKLVAEVYNPARLQNTIERLVWQINSQATQTGVPGVTLSSESAGGQIYYRLRRTNVPGQEFHYTYGLGYLVAAPSRGLVTQALQYQQSRSSIVNSTKFRSLMPADGAQHCSAILYQNLTETASSIASYVPAGVGGLTADQLKTLRQTVELTPPTLVCASGEPNRIVMGYQGDLAFNVLMLGGLRSMMETVWGNR